MREGWQRDVRKWVSEGWRRGGSKEEMGRRGMMSELEGSRRGREGWEGRGRQMNGVSASNRRKVRIMETGQGDVRYRPEWLGRFIVID